MILMELIAQQQLDLLQLARLEVENIVVWIFPHALAVLVGKDHGELPVN